MSVSAVIPTLNGEKFIRSLVHALQAQTVSPDEILVIDSSSDDNTAELALNAGADVMTIGRSEFDYGGTRNFSLQKIDSDYVLFMTQDALPCDASLIEKMLDAFSDDSIAVVYARQIARADSSEYEKLVRKFNYPESGCVKRLKDIEQMGINTFFCSNVCAMYRRDVLIKLGGFESGLKTNEDMFFAAALLHEGYAVVYEPAACVFHSHDFTFKEQYGRYKKIGYEISRHEDLLTLHATNSDGMKLVRFVSKELIKKGKLLSLFGFGFDCIARYAGNAAGRRLAEKES